MFLFFYIFGYNLVLIILSSLFIVLGYLYGVLFVWKINLKLRCNKENVIFKIWSYVYVFK